MYTHGGSVKEDYGKAWQERFWSRVSKAKHPKGCWVWMRVPDSSGHGRFCYRRKQYAAHRVSWFLANGPIPDGMHVLHSCFNAICVNPTHLYLGKDVENARDRIRADVNVSITQQEVALIRYLYREGLLSIRILSLVYEVGELYMSRIARGKVRTIK